MSSVASETLQVDGDQSSSQITQETLEVVPSTSMQETPSSELVLPSSRSASDSVLLSRSLSSEVSQSSIPLDLIKKQPVLGLLDADYILNKDPDITIIPQKQPKAPPPKVPFAFQRSTSRKELRDQMALQCLEHRAKVT